MSDVFANTSGAAFRFHFQIIVISSWLIIDQALMFSPYKSLCKFSILISIHFLEEFY